ncbi:LysM peptidoglycan-binding domain-containing protein [Thermoactinospora rubra]|uniref:LysM peptidoglycan-binding domain-containing protein n=1 Tax=Thermoactinospora rubra TaxID=1088767 RepID=UPI000A0FD817|nr:LysM peptidoglycan-binding domain-containing protein [Thermoactinospora rubra]
MSIPRHLRALNAIAVLLGIVVGFPALLHATVGSPIPDRLPTIEQIIDNLSRPDDGSLLISTLEWVAWAAWAWFVTTLAVEILARFRQARIRPRMPDVLGMRRFAAYLITSATLLASAPAALAAPAPSQVVATAPVDPAPKPPEPKIYKVKPGDTLWKIASRQLGNPRRWMQIWRLNAHHRQADGRFLSDPDLIQPGWELRLPSKKPAPHEPKTTAPHHRTRQATPPVPTASPEPTRPVPRTTEQEDQAVITIRLPSGSLITLAYVAGISTAYVAARFRRRRTSSAPESATPTPEPEPAPAIREIRRAHMQAHSDRGEPALSDAELLRQRHEAIDVPDTIALADGVQAGLSGLGLGLTGPGASAVARYLVNDLVQQAHNYRTHVIMCADMAHELYGTSPEGVPGLTVTDSAGAAFRMFEERHFTRRRMVLEREASGIDELRDRDPSEALPAVILVTGPEDELYTTVGSLLTAGRMTGTGVIVLGEWPPGTTCRIGEDRHVTEADGPLAGDLLGTEMYHLGQAEAAQHLQQLAEPSAGEPEIALPQGVDMWRGPQLVRLSILGPPLVQIRDRPMPLDLSWLQLNALAYLALHPEGVTNAQLTTALWPDEVGKDLHNTLRHLREALVSATGYVNPEPRTAPFISASTTKRTAVYRIDTSLISVDLHDYLAALDQVKTAADDEERVAALSRAAALCRGELLKGLEPEWVDEHRYALTRSQADTLSRLVALREHDDPEEAIALLERVRILEPGAEDAAIQIARIQLRLGRRDDARRTIELLRRELDFLGLRMSPAATRQVAELFSN